MDIKIVNDKGETQEVIPQEFAESNPIPTFSQDEIEDIAIGQVLGIENEISHYSDELQVIREWAKQEGYKDPMELKWMVRKLQDRLGTPPMTEKWITRVARFAHIQLQTKQLEKEEEELLR